MPTLTAAAMARQSHQVIGGRYYIFDTLTGNKCSVRNASHPRRLSRQMP
jgi:hypothetical protein